MSPALFNCGGATTSTPLASLSESPSAPRTDSLSLASVRSTAITRGPLNPGPNPSDSRSYATRIVSPAGRLLSSGCPRVRLAAGAAKANNAIVAPIVDSHGLRAIAAAILPDDLPCPSSGATLASADFLSALGSTRRPAIFKSAGTSVTAVIAETATTIAAASPIRPITSIPVT